MTGGHGHVTPRPDGARARCGGPGICAACAKEKSQLDASKALVSDMIAPTLEDVRDLREHMEEVDAYCRAFAAATRNRGNKGAEYLAKSMRDAVEASAKRLMGMPE